jgi:hypothetical protein
MEHLYFRAATFFRSFLQADFTPLFICRPCALPKTRACSPEACQRQGSRGRCMAAYWSAGSRNLIQPTNSVYGRNAPDGSCKRTSIPCDFTRFLQPPREHTRLSSDTTEITGPYLVLNCGAQQQRRDARSGACNDACNDVRRRPRLVRV